MSRRPLSQGLLDAIGTALAQNFRGGSSTSHEVGEAERVPRARRCRRDAYDGPEKLPVEGRWGLCEFTGQCVSLVKT